MSMQVCKFSENVMDLTVVGVVQHMASRGPQNIGQPTTMGVVGISPTETMESLYDSKS